MAERGSTLLEVLVALAVLGIGIAGGARLLMLGLATETRAALRETATQRLADAAELSWAWNGEPPAARVAEWHTVAGAMRPGSPDAVTSSLDRLPASAGAPPGLRAALRWGTADTDSAALRLSLSVATAATP